MGRHRPTNTGPVTATGPVSRFRRRDVMWAALTAALLVLVGGGAYAAGAAGDQVVCPPGVTLEVLPDGTWRCGATPSPTVPPTSTPSATPSTSPTPSPTVAPTPTSSPTPSSTPPPPPGFPTASTAGVPQGWTPKAIRTSWTVTAPGVYEDVRVNGSINVRAQGVTLRRVEVVGGTINNEAGGKCYNGLLLEDVTVRGTNNSSGAIQPGGYTARRVALLDVTEGFRVGGKSDAGCGPVLIEDSFARVVPPPGCGDWHGDGLQGYDAPALTIRHSTLELWELNGCGGTSAYFYPAGEAAATVDGLLVRGGGYVFRSDSPVSVRGLRVVDGTWAYGPVDKTITCPRVTSWVDNAVSDANGVALRPITC